MSDTHAAAAAPKTRAPYKPRKTATERAETKREAVVASIPTRPADLLARAQRQAKAGEVEAVRQAIQAMDDETPDAQRRAAQRRLATLTAEQAAESPEMVEVEVLRLGAGKISMGEHIPPVGDAHFEKGERLPLPLETAQLYRRKGWVDFEGYDDDGD